MKNDELSQKTNFLKKSNFPTIKSKENIFQTDPSPSNILFITNLIKK